MIARNGALIFKCDKPELVQAVIPSARRFVMKGHELIAVKHGVDQTRVLRNLGLAAPAPIKYDGYTWPGRLAPMSQQVETADFLTVNRRAFVLNEMGTGKTAAAAWAADYLIARGHIKRVLVIAPLSVIGVWVSELFQVLPHRSVGEVTGTREKRLAVLEQNYTFDVINYDGVVSTHHKELDGKGNIKRRWSDLDGRYDLIIVDEAAAYRNAGTERYKALKHLLQADTRLWLLTATPTPNAPTDAWALIKLVAPSKVPDAFATFQEAVMVKAGPYKFRPRPGAQDFVWSLMQPAVRFTKAECIDLPPVTYNNRQCTLSPDQVNMFDVMRKKMLHDDKESGIVITAMNAAVKMIKLQQICCGVVKDDNGLPVYLKPKSRLDTLTEIVEQTDAKVIVFVPFIFAMELVKDHLEKAGYNVALVNGSVGSSERTKIFAEFQRLPNPRILVAHPAVASHGITLTAADTIVWYAPIFSIESYEQANARINRIGQQNHMTIYHLGAHAFEWRIYDVLRNKAGLQNSLLNLYKEVVGG